jgi:hypothetical protein
MALLVVAIVGLVPWIAWVLWKWLDPLYRYQRRKYRLQNQPSAKIYNFDDYKDDRKAS